MSKISNTNKLAYILLFVLAAIIIISLQSCSQDFYCKSCPVKTKDSIVFITKDSISFRDTTIFIPGDSIIFHDSIPCPNFNRTFKSGRATIKVVIKDRWLTAECICDGIAARLRTYEYWHSKILANYHSEARTVSVKAPKTGFQRFKDWWFYITCLLIIGYVTAKILKTFYKWPIPLI